MLNIIKRKINRLKYYINLFKYVLGNKNTISKVRKFNKLFNYVFPLKISDKGIIFSTTTAIEPQEFTLGVVLNNYYYDKSITDVIYFLIEKKL